MMNDDDLDLFGDKNDLLLSDLIEHDAFRKKRERDERYQHLSLDGIGEEEVSIKEIELRVNKVQNKTLYCLREKQKERLNTNREWVDWRRKGETEIAGRVAILVRTREWKPKDPKYKLKQIGEENGWRSFSVSTNVLTDAERIRVNFDGKEMSLQDTLDIIQKRLKM